MHFTEFENGNKVLEIEGKSVDIPKHINTLLEAVVIWNNKYRQPERSKREDHESGCGALNIMET